MPHNSPASVLFTWSVAFGRGKMSRMRKQRGDAQRDGVAERRASRLEGERRGPAREGEFVRAFADALRDILVHERRRAA